MRCQARVVHSSFAFSQILAYMMSVKLYDFKLKWYWPTFLQLLSLLFRFYLDYLDFI